MQDVYKALREERAAKVDQFNAKDVTEEARTSLTNEINEIDGRMDALVSRLESDAKAAEAANKAAELLAASEGRSDVADETPELRNVIYDAEFRAAVQVPTFLESDTSYGKKIVPDTIVNDFIGRFDVRRAPYKEYTEVLHALSSLTFVNATEATALTRTDPTVGQVSTVSTTKKSVFTSLSNEAIQEVDGLEGDLVAEINLAYAKLIRSQIVDAVNTTANSVDAAAADATVAEGISLLWDTLPTEDKGDVIYLASAAAISDLAVDSGNDNFFYDPATQQKVLQGRPVLLAPNLGGTSSGDTLIAAVNPKAVSVRAAGLRVAKDGSFLFGNDETAFRGTTYVGAGINSADHVAKLAIA